MNEYLLGCSVLGATDPLIEHVDPTQIERSQQRGVWLGYAAGTVGAVLLGYGGAALFAKHKVIAAALGGVIGWGLGAGFGPLLEDVL